MLVIFLSACSNLYDSTPEPPQAVDPPVVWAELGLPPDGAVPIRATEQRLELWLVGLPGEGSEAQRAAHWLRSALPDTLVALPGAQATTERGQPVARFSSSDGIVEAWLQQAEDGRARVVALERLPRPAAEPLPEVPTSWTLPVTPLLPRLKTEQVTCMSDDGSAVVFYPDGQHEVHYGDRSSVLRWKPAAQGFTLEGPEGTFDPTPCDAPRQASTADGAPATLLCAQRRWDCGLGLSGEPTVLVRDGGAGAQATTLVARVLAGELDEGGLAPVFQLEPADGPSSITVMVGDALQTRPTAQLLLETRARALASALDRDLVLDGVQLVQQPGAPAPIVVTVGGSVQPRIR